MPPKEDWNLAEDSVTDALRLIVKVLPNLGFADVTSTEDRVQKEWFAITGGRDDDCCIDGCRCDRPQKHGVRGGRLDWTKTRKVAVLQRQHNARNNYRSFISEGTNHFLLLHNQFYTSSGLHAWMQSFSVSTITLDNRVALTGYLSVCRLVSVVTCVSSLPLPWQNGNHFSPS